MTRFRPHRGSLEASLAEAVDVADFAALFEHLAAMFGETMRGRVTVEPYQFDRRIGWDTHIVKLAGVPVGFTDGPIEL